MVVLELFCLVSIFCMSMECDSSIVVGMFSVSSMLLMIMCLV